MTKLEKIINKIANARDKRFGSKRKLNFSDWVSTKYMTNLRRQFNDEVQKLESQGIKVSSDFGDYLC